jgi:curved DNA-binding protein CbpA
VTVQYPDFDLYAELHVASTASEEAIAASYHRLARSRHPDLNPGVDASRMQRLNRAFAILSNAEQRRMYDARRASWNRAPRASVRTSQTVPTDQAKARAPRYSARRQEECVQCRRCHRVFPATAQLCPLCGASPNGRGFVIRDAARELRSREPKATGTRGAGSARGRR